LAYTFLQAVNATAKRVKLIQGSAGEFASFTDSARQTELDFLLVSWNDVIDTLYNMGHLQGELAESSFTLVTGTREYDLASDFIQMAGDPVDPTNENTLTHYPGGYRQMRLDQRDSTDYSGRPRRWARNETNGKIRVDSTPTASENGDVYTYLYDKRINLTAITDTFPFSDDVVDALQAAVSQTWQRERRGQFDEAAYLTGLANAAAFLRSVPLKEAYGAYS